MAQHLTIGRLGEDVAANYLSSLGFSIVARNVHMRIGEIDIVAHNPDCALVFAEVKTLSLAASLSPEDNLTRAKFAKLSRACSAYANAHPNIINPSLGWRIDLLAIVCNQTTQHASDAVAHIFNGQQFFITHYQNIFL